MPPTPDTSSQPVDTTHPIDAAQPVDATLPIDTAQTVNTAFLPVKKVLRVVKAGTPKPPEQNGLYSESEIKYVVDAVEYDTAINKKANYLKFKDKYDAKFGKGYLDAIVAKGVHTAHGNQIIKAFLENKEYGVAASLAEALPLYANTPGRLGQFIKANVTKTAKADDQGLSFSDLVIEIKNEWIENGAPREMQNVPAKMTFIVDVTSAPEGLKYANKVKFLRDNLLLYGEKVKVWCYENEYGDLGVEKPKLLVAKSADYLKDVGGKLGSCITKSAADKFTISSPQKFDEEYRAYFLDLMTAIGENAKANAEYIGRLSNDNEKRSKLKAEYEKIVAFVEVYKKTPVTRPRS